LKKYNLALYWWWHRWSVLVEDSRFECHPPPNSSDRQDYSGHPIPCSSIYASTSLKNHDSHASLQHRASSCRACSRTCVDDLWPPPTSKEVSSNLGKEIFYKKNIQECWWRLNFQAKAIFILILSPLVIWLGKFGWEI